MPRLRMLNPQFSSVPSGKGTWSFALRASGATPAATGKTSAADGADPEHRLKNEAQETAGQPLCMSCRGRSPSSSRSRSSGSAPAELEIDQLLSNAMVSNLGKPEHDGIKFMFYSMAGSCLREERQIISIASSFQLRDQIISGKFLSVS